MRIGAFFILCFTVLLSILSVKLQAQSGNSYNQLYVQIESGRGNEVLPQLNRFIQQNPGHVSARFERAKILERQLLTVNPVLRLNQIIIQSDDLLSSYEKLKQDFDSVEIAKNYEYYQQFLRRNPETRVFEVNRTALFNNLDERMLLVQRFKLEAELINRSLFVIINSYNEAVDQYSKLIDDSSQSNDLLLKSDKSLNDSLVRFNGLYDLIVSSKHTYDSLKEIFIGSSQLINVNVRDYFLLNSFEDISKVNITDAALDLYNLSMWSDELRNKLNFEVLPIKNALFSDIQLLFLYRGESCYELKDSYDEQYQFSKILDAALNKLNQKEFAENLVNLYQKLFNYSCLQVFLDKNDGNATRVEIINQQIQILLEMMYTIETLNTKQYRLYADRYYHDYFNNIHEDYQDFELLLTSWLEALEKAKSRKVIDLVQYRADKKYMTFDGLEIALSPINEILVSDLNNFQSTSLASATYENNFFLSGFISETREAFVLSFNRDREVLWSRRRNEQVTSSDSSKLKHHLKLVTGDSNHLLWASEWLHPESRSEVDIWLMDQLGTSIIIEKKKMTIQGKIESFNYLDGEVILKTWSEDNKEGFLYFIASDGKVNRKTWLRP
ncbi:MAG: hypothetical protein LAT68_08860 [Cyclobacteriaceae bacterium]|nr:hypothetical protein [Cyclobacteriaceae bacterium]MCH8516425.1 hypothetical protein [Cyclobacteriaceae bacterium]